MKFEQVVLHIGPHKTGSTTIQEVCDKSRALLENSGVLYPSGGWHPQFGSYFCKHPVGFIYNRLAGRTDENQIRREDSVFMKELSEQIEHASCRLLVLSYEGFIDLDIASLQGMREFLALISKKVTVVGYARPPLEFACSQISQAVKFGVFNSSQWPTDFLLAYKSFLPKFAEVFGDENVIIRKLVRSELPEGNIAFDFFSLLGVQVDQLMPVGCAINSNQSLSAEATLIGMAIERIDACQNPNDFMRRYLPLLERIGGARITLTARQADLLLSTAKEHLDWLLQEYGIEFEPESHLINDSPKLFSSDTLESLAGELCALVNRAT